MTIALLTKLVFGQLDDNEGGALERGEHSRWRAVNMALFKLTVCGHKGEGLKATPLKYSSR